MNQRYILIFALLAGGATLYFSPSARDAAFKALSAFTGSDTTGTAVEPSPPSRVAEEPRAAAPVAARPAPQAPPTSVKPPTAVAKTPPAPTSVAPTPVPPPASTYPPAAPAPQPMAITPPPAPAVASKGPTPQEKLTEMRARLYTMLSDFREKRLSEYKVSATRVRGRLEREADFERLASALPVVTVEEPENSRLLEDSTMALTDARILRLDIEELKRNMPAGGSGKP